METPSDDTQPGIYWGEPDSDAAADLAWLARCRRRLLQRLPRLLERGAPDLADGLGTDERDPRYDPT